MTPVIFLLGAIVALLLGIKLVATVILLRRPSEARLVDRRGRQLWWATKITPVFAVPCAIIIAWLDDEHSNLVLYCGLMVFVMVAVPWKIWRHRRSLFAQAKGPEFPPALS